MDLSFVLLYLLRIFIFSAEGICGHWMGGPVHLCGCVLVGGLCCSSGSEGLTNLKVFMSQRLGGEHNTVVCILASQQQTTTYCTVYMKGNTSKCFWCTGRYVCWPSLTCAADGLLLGSQSRSSVISRQPSSLAEGMSVRRLVGTSMGNLNCIAVASFSPSAQVC